MYAPRLPAAILAFQLFIWHVTATETAALIQPISCLGECGCHFAQTDIKPQNSLAQVVVTCREIPISCPSITTTIKVNGQSLVRLTPPLLKDIASEDHEELYKCTDPHISEDSNKPLLGHIRTLTIELRNHTLVILSDNTLQDTPHLDKLLLEGNRELLCGLFSNVQEMLRVDNITVVCIDGTMASTTISATSVVTSEMRPTTKATVSATTVSTETTLESDGPGRRVVLHAMVVLLAVIGGLMAGFFVFKANKMQAMHPVDGGLYYRL